MSDALQHARILASKLRYSEDYPISDFQSDESNVDVIKEYFALNALRITGTVTPALYMRLESVYRRLQIPQASIDAYVQSSADIQAEAFTGHSSQCVIRFSSALIDILDEDEFNFVAGHELGHFLLEHRGAGRNAKSLEYYMRQRSQEISADRLGLLAGGSLDVAIKALIKTVSGLTSAHLRFDVGAFIAQLRRDGGETLVENHNATHPSVFVRCKALLWFSMTNGYLAGNSDWSNSELTTLNQRVKSDFDKFVDGPVRKRIERAKDELMMWSTAFEMASDGVFTKAEQATFASMFGEEILCKLTAFLQGYRKTEVADALAARVKASRAALTDLIPESADREIKEITAATQTVRSRV